MDGSGKSTLLAALRTWLDGTEVPPGIDALVFGKMRSMPRAFLAEPTGLPSGMELRRRLSSSNPPGTQEWIELFRADRKANLETFVLPALSAGSLVFQDRYYYSTAAYQGAFSELGPAAVLAVFNSWCPPPDLLVYLTIEVDEAFARMKKRGGVAEVFERQDRWIRIRDAYESILPADALRIDGLLSPVENAARILEELAGRLAVFEEKT